MKNNFTYFKEYFKSNLRVLFYTSIVALICCFVLGLEGQKPQFVEDGYKSTLYLPIIVLCILCYVIPVQQFSVFKKRKNLDCYYSMPISRRALGTVHYLTGLLLVLIPFSLCYLLNLILLLTRPMGTYSLVYLIPHYFVALSFIFIMYSVFVFVFNEANTTSDGIWFMALYTFVFALIAELPNAFSNDYTSMPIKNSEFGIIWLPIDSITTSYQHLVENYDGDFTHYFSNGQSIAWYIFWIIVGVLAALRFFLTFGSRRTEKTEEISDSWFGYRTLIPVYAVCALFQLSGEVIFLVIVELLAFIGYTVYRRGFHYKKSDIIILLSLLVFMLF